MGLRLPNIARSPQVTAPHCLRERSFDACARRVSLFESRFHFLAARLLQGAELRFRLNRQQAASAGRLRALCPLRARLAVARREFDLNLFAAVTVRAFLPTATYATCRAGGYAPREVIVEIGRGKA
jgi:hypothetical protein